MNALTAFGLFAVTMMLVFYALEERNDFYALPFAASCVLCSAYGFLQGSWPFGMLEAIWAIVALRRWVHRRPSEVNSSSPSGDSHAADASL